MARQKDSDGTMQCKKSKVQPRIAQSAVEGKWDLPAGWEWKRLGEVCPYIQRGKSPTYTNADGIPVINQKCIRWSEVLLEHIKYTKQVPSLDEKRLVKKNDILWNSTGTGTIGRAFFVQKEFHFKCVVDSHVTILRPASHIFSKFVHYFIMSNFVQQNIEKMQSGSTNQVELSKEAICDLDIPLPPTVQDQERIVERVDSLFAELDKAEETLRHTITLCEQYKQSVLKAAVTGELSKEWRKANTPTETGEQLLQRILKERRAAWEKAELAKMTAKGQKPANDNWKKKYKEPQAPDTSGLPELPEGWTWASMDMLGDVKGGITVDRKKVYDISVPYLRVANVQEGFFDLSEVKTITASQEIIDNLRLERGDILLNEGGDRDKLGRGWVWDNDLPLCIHQNHVFRARLFVKEFISEFISTYTNTFGKQFFFDEGKQTTNLASISMTKLKSIPIPVPPVGEQGYIFNSINQHIDENNIALDFCNKNLVQTTALRQSILKQAFTGQLA